MRRLTGRWGTGRRALAGGMAFVTATLLAGACNDSAVGPKTGRAPAALTVRSTSTAVLRTREGTVEVSPIFQTWRWAPDRAGTLRGTLLGQTGGALRVSPHAPNTGPQRSVGVSEPERAPTPGQVRADAARAGRRIRGYSVTGNDGKRHAFLTTERGAASADGAPDLTVHFIDGKAITRSRNRSAG